MSTVMKIRKSGPPGERQKRRLFKKCARQIVKDLKAEAMKSKIIADASTDDPRFNFVAEEEEWQRALRCTIWEKVAQKCLVSIRPKHPHGIKVHVVFTKPYHPA